MEQGRDRQMRCQIFWKREPHRETYGFPYNPFPLVLVGRYNSIHFEPPSEARYKGRFKRKPTVSFKIEVILTAFYRKHTNPTQN